MSQPRARHPRHAGVVADSVDFRDRMYAPSLIDVPQRLPIDGYRKYKIPIHDQGHEPACTGFALATVANYLLRRRRVDPDEVPVSARMLYEIAKRYDEWAGEHHTGSSARGAMKGWHKHGVCAESLWPYREGDDVCVLTRDRAADALRRPLGAYFRVDAKDLAGMHAALAEVGILSVTAGVHEGWHEVRGDGIIPWPRDHIGAHAFAIIGYDQAGFWLQNSKGPDWGQEGFARISYADWLANGQDVWVARLGVPIAMTAQGGQATRSRHDPPAHAFAALRPHIVSIAGSGVPQHGGTYATPRHDIAAIIGDDIPAATAKWKRRRILVIAPSGLGGEAADVQQLDGVRDALMADEIYPLAISWDHQFAPALRDIIGKASHGKQAGEAPKDKEFLLHRLDDTIEPVARRHGGRTLWEHLKRHAAHSAIAEDGALRLVAQRLAALAKRLPDAEIHLAGYSLGALIVAWLAPLLALKSNLPAGFGKSAGHGTPIASLTLCAPACSIELFAANLMPAIGERAIAGFALYTLSPAAEAADNTAGVYHRSLLTLLGRAFETTPFVAGHSAGTPMLGRADDVAAATDLAPLWRSRLHERIVAGETAASDGTVLSTATHHDDFAGNEATRRSIVARILASRS